MSLYALDLNTGQAGNSAIIADVQSLQSSPGITQHL